MAFWVKDVTIEHPEGWKKEISLRDTWTSATHSATFSSGVVLLAEAGLPSEWESLLDDETGLCGLASGGLGIEVVNLVEVYCLRTWRFIAGGLGGFED